MKRLLIVLTILGLAVPCAAQRRTLRGGISVAPVAPTPTLTTPADDAINRSISLSLNYTVSGTCTNAELNFGESDPPMANVDNDVTCGGSFSPGPLDYETEYFWSITVCNGAACTTSAVRSFTTAMMGSITPLSSGDLSCGKLFLSGEVAAGPYGSGGLALRYVSGVAHYYQLSGDGHVYEFLEPAGTADCTTNPESLTAASNTNDWGIPTLAAGDNIIPGSPPGVYSQFRWDPTTAHFLVGWRGTYGNIPHETNSLAALVPDDGAHTFSTWGCWAADNTPQPYVGSGVSFIPSWFTDAYLSPGETWLWTGGGYLASIGAGLSMGPTTRPFVPPATNACTAGVNNIVTVGDALSEYPTNIVGPTCVTSLSGAGLGCTPSQAPTVPYQGQIDLLTYSIDTYPTDWDPYAGLGYYNSTTSLVLDWYDDGQKTGILVPLMTSEGWSNTSVSASPAPTIDDGGDPCSGCPTGTMTIASTSTHDGGNIAPGELIWIQTCTIGVTPNCNNPINNGNAFSFAQVDTVNTSTGAITFHLSADHKDSGTGDHKPVVGAPVYFGAVYMQGAPTASRHQRRMQFYDPASLAAVAMGDPTYSVLASEDLLWSALVPGAQTLFSTIFTNVSARYQTPIQVIADPDHYRILVSFQQSKFNGTNSSSAVFVFDVAH